MLLVEPFTFAVDLDAGAVDEDMQRFIVDDPLWQNGQTAAATTERGVVGNSDLNAEQIRDRSQRTLGLTKRLMQHKPKRQFGLDSDVGIDRLAAPLSGCRCIPRLHGIVGVTRYLTFGILLRRLSLTLYGMDFHGH